MEAIRKTVISYLWHTIITAFGLSNHAAKDLPELITTGQDGDDPVKQVTRQGNILVFHLHLDIFEIQGRVLAVDLQCTLIDRASSICDTNDKQSSQYMCSFLNGK